MNRETGIQQLQSPKEWDVIVIGGGATGIGIAIDAASRGYSTLLLEKNDFAKGTSSRSTKLVHGGVRYLAQGNIKLVKEALRERGRMLANAPHICKKAPFIVPAYKWTDKIWYGIGLKLYDLMAGKLGLGKTRLLNRKAVIEMLPSVNRQKLRGGILYYDGQFDDARLAISMAQTATERGATVINHIEVSKLLHENGRVSGVQCTDHIGQVNYTIRAKVVVNATGVFAGAMMKEDDHLTHDIIAASQGIHIVLDKKFFPGTDALMIPKTDDGRVLFAIPWQNKVLVGTTDTPVNTLSEEPLAMEEEINFLIRHFNRYHQTTIQRSDVLSVFAGLRPLVKRKDVKNTASLSRDHTLIIAPSKLLTITGGKWTTWRKMAEDAVNHIAEITGQEPRKCVTANLHIHGYTNEPMTDSHLQYYGSDAAAIRELMQEPGMERTLHAAHPFTVAEVVWALRYEMAQTVEDVLARRVRLLFLDANAAMATAPLVAAIMAKEWGKDEHWQKQQAASFNETAGKYLLH